MKCNVSESLASYVDALYPIIYINYFDFKLVDSIIATINEDVCCIEFNNALGKIDFHSKSPICECDIVSFLKNELEDSYDDDKKYKNGRFIVLKDIHKDLENPIVISLLKRIAENNLYLEKYNLTVFNVSDYLYIPKELENYITILDVPLPTSTEIISIIRDFSETLDIHIEEDVINDIAFSFKGMNEYQIKQILNLAYQNGGAIPKDDRNLILKEKEQFIKKTNLLELINLKEEITDIGGLENLKIWLQRKAKIFEDLDRATKFGVDVPKGMMIIGVPGCGKSLSAKATASLFKVPLVRLDIGRLLGKYVGESEENMRKTLRLSEAISPCVLWIDEIEKAFSGIREGNEVTTRLFGNFLTWLQEKENSVFVVATANDISKLPSEFLRKGRFDEIFFVDLPNDEERKQILEIHLKKRKKWNLDIDIYSVVKKTKDYSGADLEFIVKETIETAFIDNKNEISTLDFLQTIETNKLVCETKGYKDNLEKYRKEIENINIRKANK